MKNKILSILLATGIALALWMYVITVVNPEYTKTYKLKVNPDEFQYSSVLADRKLMITECDEYVTVKLKGNRSTLVTIRESDLKVETSVASVNSAGTYQLDYSVSVPGAILVEEQKPAQITIKVDNKVTTQLDIKADIKGEVPDGFVADTDDIFEGNEDGKVTIAGPGAVVKNIAYAKLDDTIDLTGKQEDIIGDYELVLCDKNGKPVDAAGVSILGSKKVSVRIRIEMFKDIKLGLNITEGGGLTKEQVKIEPQTIRISGPKAAVEALGDTLILGELDLSRLDMDQKLEPFPIDLKDDRIKNRSGIEEAVVTVDFGKLIQKDLMVRNVKIIAPEGMAVTLDRNNVPVTVRGFANQLDQLTEADISVTVDFSKVTGNTALKEVEITIDPRFRDVVWVGEPAELSAKLTKKEG